MDKLLLLFVLLPLVELALLTALSHYTSLPTTILFIIVTGLLGTWMSRSQGLSTYRRIQAELAAGRMPRDSLIDGVLILLAGVLLITPGVLTDLFGIFLMFPPSRRLFRIWLMGWFGRHFKIQTFQTATYHPGTESDVMDTYATETPESTPTLLNSGEESQ
jgi:UPF0716 protein FxsA